MNKAFFWKSFFTNTVMFSYDQKKILWLEIGLEIFRHPSQKLSFIEPHWACWNRGSNIFKHTLFTLKSWPRPLSRTTKPCSQLPVAKSYLSTIFSITELSLLWIWAEVFRAYLLHIDGFPPKCSFRSYFKNRYNQKKCHHALYLFFVPFCLIMIG